MEKIILDAAVENIETATRFVEGELQKYNSLNIGQIAVAIDELFGNIAKYAYKDGAGKVEVQVEVTGEPPVAAVTFKYGTITVTGRMLSRSGKNCEK